MSLKSKYYYEEGIILFKKKIGEGDLLLTIFGKQKGKILVKAPGALKIKNRLRGRVEIFTVGRGYFVKRKELDLLISWEVHERFNNIVEDVSKFFLVSKFIREIDKFIPLEVKDMEIYNMIYSFLKYWKVLDETVGNIFVIKVLQKLGYLSSILLECQKCGKNLINEKDIYVDISNNKAFCVNCKNMNLYSTKVEALLGYNTILNMDFNTLLEKDLKNILNESTIMDILTKIKTKVEEEV